MPAGINISLEIQSAVNGINSAWSTLGTSYTATTGRLAHDLLPAGTELEKAVYRATFHTGPYFKRQSRETFFPEVAIMFEVVNPAEHHHIPLLLSPYGYSTYRGS